MRDGFDWEVLDPHDAWSYIGYWGDHQVVYLLKLLEVSARYHPGALGEPAARGASSPTRTSPTASSRTRRCSKIRATPSSSTRPCDREIRAARRRRWARTAKLLPGADGAPYRVNLAEKLLVLALARLFNYIPEAGIWMNTQRPEWNDANNALVGYGVSMVTLYYLRRFLSFCRGLFEPQAVEVSAEVAEAFRRVAAALERHAGLLDGPISDQRPQGRARFAWARRAATTARRSTPRLFGEAGRAHRRELTAFCDVALAISTTRSAPTAATDGLYHAYNLMKVAGDGIAIRRLYEMLEGQVAVLGSGALSAGESAALLDALRASKLYRADQNSYVLYPDRRLPGFLEKNNIPAAALADRAPDEMLLAAIAASWFETRTAGLISTPRSATPRCSQEALGDGSALPDAETRRRSSRLYEEVFDHQSFTGRSGTFYKYEGLGCIYWHMVSKLLLAVQEAMDRAAAAGEDPAVVERLRRHYREIREGIGAHKPPELYGAIPTDPYSHTPGFAGVQQPGMTGQVKEDLISRLGEMGVAVEGGRLSFRAHLVNRDEFLKEAGTFSFYDLALEPGTLAFTICQVPVVAHQAGPPRVEVSGADGSRRTVDGLDLDTETSAAVFERTGAVRRLDVFFALGQE